MKKPLTVFLFFALAILPVFFMSAQANPILFFAPQRVDVSDKEPIQEIRLTNTTDIARAYKITVQNFVMNEDGATELVPDFDYSAKRMVRFVPRKFDIQPGKTQIVRVMARIPPETADGEFHSHMEFTENTERRAELNKDIASEQQKARMMAQISYAAAIPVTVSKGEIKTNLTLETAAIQKNNKGELAADVVITREGNGQGRLFLEADYIASDGSVSPAASRRTVVVYREINRRKHNFTLDLLDPTATGGEVKIKLFNRDVSADEPAQEMVVPLG